MNHSEAEKAEMLAEQQHHLSCATKAREKMNADIARCKAGIEGYDLGRHDPLTGPEFAHYGFDFAQQVL